MIYGFILFGFENETNGINYYFITIIKANEPSPSIDDDRRKHVFSFRFENKVIPCFSK